MHRSQWENPPARHRPRSAQHGHDARQLSWRTSRELGAGSDGFLPRPPPSGGCSRRRRRRGWRRAFAAGVLRAQANVSRGAIERISYYRLFRTTASQTNVSVFPNARFRFSQMRALPPAFTELRKRTPAAQQNAATHHHASSNCDTPTRSVPLTLQGPRQPP